MADSSVQMSCFHASGILANTRTLFCPHFKIRMEERGNQISLQIHAEDCSCEDAYNIAVNVDAIVRPDTFWLDYKKRFACMQFLSVKDEKNFACKSLIFLSLQTVYCTQDKNIVDYFESICKKFEGMGVPNRRRDMSSLYKNMENGVFWHQRGLLFLLHEKQQKSEMVQMQEGTGEKSEDDLYEESMNLTVSMAINIGRRIGREN